MVGNWDTMTLSITDLQEEFMEQGEAGPGAALLKAKEAFPQKLSDLLDDDWKVMHGGDSIVYLRREK